MVGFIIAKLFGFIQLRKSLNHRRGAVTRSSWVSFDILMQFKFSVWSSNWADKLCISDRLIIWLAGLIRGRVAADYIQHNTVSTGDRGPAQRQRRSVSPWTLFVMTTLFEVLMSSLRIPPFNMLGCSREHIRWINE